MLLKSLWRVAIGKNLLCCALVARKDFIMKFYVRISDADGIRNGIEPGLYQVDINPVDIPNDLRDYMAGLYNSANEPLMTQGKTVDKFFEAIRAKRQLEADKQLFIDSESKRIASMTITKDDCDNGSLGTGLWSFVRKHTKNFQRFDLSNEIARAVEHIRADDVKRWGAEYKAEQEVRERAEQERKEFVKAEIERDKERAEQDRINWINAHGSDRLKKLATLPYPWVGVYRDERMTLERPGWNFPHEDMDQREPRNLPGEIVDKYLAEKNTFPDCSLYYDANTEQYYIEDQIDKQDIIKYL